MIEVFNNGVYLIDGEKVMSQAEAEAYLREKGAEADSKKYRKGTIANKIMSAHNVGKSEENLQITFDSLISHDITYVGIIQTARASGLEKFPRHDMLNRFSRTFNTKFDCKEYENGYFD